MNEIFLISDTHFGHRNIIDYCSRPFQDVQQMNTELIKRWNEVVTDFDLVYMLGDFALYSKEEVIEIGRRLRGNKILLRANHDRCSNDTYFQAGFLQVVKKPIILEDFILTHIPMENSDMLNIHGHTHNHRANDNNHFCVSVEMVNYYPINLEEIKKYFNERIRYTN